MASYGESAGGNARPFDCRRQFAIDFTLPPPE
jgi:hypothetical protein